MICIGSIKKLETELERMVTTNYPDRLSDPTLINIACAYEQALKRKTNK